MQVDGWAAEVIALLRDIAKGINYLVRDREMQLEVGIVEKSIQKMGFAQKDHRTWTMSIERYCIEVCVPCMGGFDRFSVRLVSENSWECTQVLLPDANATLLRVDMMISLANEQLAEAAKKKEKAT